MTSEPDDRVGVVVIGRNEGERLVRCLESLAPGTTPVVYVDSGSTDGSSERARSLGAVVVELDTSIAFSAARARNAGLARLRELGERLAYVQFVDGDCEVDSGWLEAAVDTLRREPGVGVVAGRRRERFPERSVYNLLCDIEWDSPIGEVASCGGDAMFRVTAFDQAGGFNPDVIAGEEPELCVRLRGAGWKVLRLDREMTLHDAAMTRFSQWWKRAVRSGHASAELAHRHGQAKGRPGVHRTVSNLAWGVGLPVGLTAVGAGPIRWCGTLLYPALAARIYAHRRRRESETKRALLYSLACTVGKFPEALGAVRFYYGIALGRRAAIIEYKGLHTSTESTPSR